MKNTKQKIKKLIIFPLTFLVLVAFLFFWEGYKEKKATQVIQNTKYPSNFYYKVFNYSSYYKNIQEQYLKKAAEYSKIDEDTKQSFGKNEVLEAEKPKEQNNEPIKDLEESVLISSSLTNSPGVISVSGKSEGIKVFYLDQHINQNENNFYFSAGPTFVVRLEGRKSKITVSISSPSYGTNKIISQLTLQVNPINMTATIIGKLNLMLPGEIKGSLYNLSNSSSSSTILKAGYFATSVTLKEGANTLTATGEWFTIRLDLPTLKVVVTK